MQRKTWMRASALALALALSLVAGCGGKSATETKPAATPAANTPAPAKKDPVKIQFWHTFKSELTFPVVDELVKKWNAEHPEIQVEHQGFGAEMADKVKVALTGKQAPDIVVSSPSVYYEPAGKTREQIEKESPIAYLDNLIDKAYRDQFFDVVWEQQQRDWKGFVAMPIELVTDVMFYDKAAYKAAGLDPEKPPKTYAEFHDVLKKLTKKEGGVDKYGYAFSSKDKAIWSSTVERAGVTNGVLVPLAYQKKTGEWVLNLANDRTAEGWEALYGKPVKENWTPKPNAYDWMGVREMIGQGTVANYIVGAYMVGVYDQKYKNLDYGMAEFPMGQNGYYAAAGNNDTTIFNEKFGGHPKEAVEFLKWFTNAQNQAFFMTKAGKAMPNKGAYDPKLVTPRLAAVRAIMDTRMTKLKDIRAQIVAAYPDVQTDELNGAKIPQTTAPQNLKGGQLHNFADAEINKVIMGQGDIKTALLNIEKEWATILKDSGLKVDESSIGWNKPEVKLAK